MDSFDFYIRLGFEHISDFAYLENLKIWRTNSKIWRANKEMWAHYYKLDPFSLNHQENISFKTNFHQN